MQVMRLQSHQKLVEEKTIVRAMCQTEIPLDVISECTGVTIEEVKKPIE